MFRYLVPRTSSLAPRTSRLAPHASHLTPRTSRLAAAAGRGFTLLELLVVMSIVALLVAIAVPRYMHGTDKAREAVLAENLARMRAAIDSYHADRGRYPDSLEDLVERKYLRRVPVDPVTENAATWVLVAPAVTLEGKVADVKSGAPGNGRDGRAYAEW